MFFSSKKVLGLDIGSNTIKAAEIEVKGKSVTLTGFAMGLTPPECLSAGDIIDPENLGMAVRSVLDELNSKRKLVSVGLWGTSIIIKKISVPAMDENLLAEQIKWEAEQYIPFDINEVNLEYKVLKGVSRNQETMELLLVAARQESVMRYAEVVLHAGYECEILDVGGFALANAFEANYGVLSGQVVAVFNVGASVTNFIVIENGELVFCRDVPVGGATYSMELQKSLGISLAEAEAMKLSIGRGEPAPEEAQGALNATHEILQEELSGAVEFFMNTNQSANIVQAYVTGGASKTQGMIQALQQGLKIPCDAFDPFFNVKYSQRAFSDSYIREIRNYAAVAIGLGLRQGGDHD
ncbi:MAG: type IV pilus assembly protein PilM [Bdellovibrionales bacterium]|nr:type IV pilus assembly protein PilM [Bdellovibrionales bacterium]